MINRMRPSRLVVPHCGGRDAERVIDRRRHVFGSLRIGGWITADAIGGAGHLAALNAAPGKEHRLHRAPMIAAWSPIDIGKLCNLRRPPKLARHDDQSLIELPT